MSERIRILLLADTHLGLDLPVRPRVERRRRGHDFLANYAAALAPALAGEVDVVVHGGDVFDSPRVSASVVHQAFAPLARVAGQGVPVFVVAGNHERSRLPQSGREAHALVHVFDRPRTFVVGVRGVRVALAGFPCARRDIRTRFADTIAGTGWREAGADVTLLCMHQCVEGAKVGPADFTFTSAADVVRGRDIPEGLAAVLSGHIHRHQVLTSDLRGRPLAAPVLYPGSIERTSIAEAQETKGYLILDVPAGAQDDGLRWDFRPLPARPMRVQELHADGMTAARLDTLIRTAVAAAPGDAVLRLRVRGVPAAEAGRILSAAYLRSLAPATMNLEIRVDGAPYGWPQARRETGHGAEGRSRRRGSARPAGAPGESTPGGSGSALRDDGQAQLELGC
jgi:DNA repair protein SbcD/Mre11